MVITGELKCKNCGREIKWYSQLAKNAQFMPECDTIPSDRVVLSPIEKIDDGIYIKPISGNVQCENCKTENFIENIK